MKDATTFVDELKDKVHEQNFIIKEQEETIKRLDKLRTYKVVVEYLKDKLMTSNITNRRCQLCNEHFKLCRR